MKTANCLFFLTLLALPLLWTSCDDGLLDYTLVKGVVRDAGTGTPLANAKVSLYKSPNYFNINSGGAYVIDTFITDETGRYSFQFEEVAGDGYEIGATKEGYYEAEPGGDLLSNRENTADVHLYAKAWIRIHVKNVNPFDEHDNFQYTGSWAGGYPDDHFGMDVDFIETIEIKGNKNTIIWWSVVRDGLISPYSDTIYCEGHKVTDYEILY